MNWEQERAVVLNWWPVTLAGSKTQGYMLVDSLEDAAWGCGSEHDWNEWLDQVEKIWGGPAQLMSFHHPSTDGIDFHLGPTLGQALIDKATHRNKNLMLRNKAAGLPQRASYGPDIQQLADRLSQEFGISRVMVSRSSSPTWIKKQLMDAVMGLGNMATLVGIAGPQVGKKLLNVWFHEHSLGRGSVAGDHQHIEIHQNGGNIAQSWAYWKFQQINSLPGNPIPSIASSWRRSWVRSARRVVEHQQQFLNKSQQALKQQQDLVAVTSEMGQRIFRRYRAICKWVDEISRGASFDSIHKHWNKVKIGNRIAWSGEHAQGYERIIQNWNWEERLIEAAFWKAPRWHVPSWVQRQLALTHDYWPKQDYDFDNKDLMALWALGFESLVRQKVTYDGWVAMDQVCHPHGTEAQDFGSFYEEYLQELIQT